MNAPHTECQPEADEPHQHVCPDGGCIYLGQPSFRGCGCHKTREQMMLARIEELTKALEWRPIETAPHGKRVLLGWRDWRDHQWCVEAAAATTGQRFTNGYSTMSQHGSATHWQPVPEGPAMSLEQSGSGK